MKFNKKMNRSGGVTLPSALRREKPPMNQPEVFGNPCAICKTREATRLCDYVIGYEVSILFLRNYKDFMEENMRCKHGTCDLPMCQECAESLGTHVDFCPHHYKLFKQAELPPDLKKYQIRQRAKLQGG